MDDDIPSYDVHPMGTRQGPAVVSEIRVFGGEMIRLIQQLGFEFGRMREVCGRHCTEPGWWRCPTAPADDTLRLARGAGGCVG